MHHIPILLYVVSTCTTCIETAKGRIGQEIMSECCEQILQRICTRFPCCFVLSVSQPTRVTGIFPMVLNSLQLNKIPCPSVLPWEELAEFNHYHDESR